MSDMVNRSIRSVVAGMVLCVMGAAAQQAEAATKPAVVVLDFGGKDGKRVRATVVRSLSGKYRVLPGSRLIAACRELGIAMQRGANLGKAARHVGAIGVVGGAAGRGQLALAVYSAETGDASVSRSFRLRQQRAAMALVSRALSRLATAAAQAAQSSGDEMVVEPEEEATVDESATDDRPTRQPPVQKKPDTGLSFDPSETSTGNDQNNSTSIDMNLTAAPEENPLKKKTPVASDAGVSNMKLRLNPWMPRVWGLVGVGTWMRSFSINDHVGPGIRPAYSSGTPFALSFAAGSHPAAFFTDQFWANFLLRMQLQMVLGQSAHNQKTNTTFGTSLSEFLFEFGYEFDFSSVPPGGLRLSPYIGFGLCNFGTDSQPDPPQLPSASYNFLILGAGVNYPLWTYLEAFTKLNYRVVFGTGEIEEDDWYGPSQTGGIDVALGLNVAFRKFIGTVSYEYTRYFYAFTDAAARLQSGKRTGGGALDEFHAIMISLGYSY